MSQKRTGLTIGIPHWMSSSHPVYHLESSRRTQTRSLNLLRQGCLPIIFAVTGLAIGVMLVIVGTSTLLWNAEETPTVAMGGVFGVMLVIQLLMGAMTNILVLAQTAPTISGEIELQSWRLLRTTTLPMREIILAKLSAALRQILQPFSGLLILRLISASAGVFGLIYTLLRNEYWNIVPSDRLAFWQAGEWLPIFIMATTFTVFYLAQPFIQLVLNGVLGMLSSAYSRTRSRAIITALSGRLFGWVGSILFYMLAFTAFGFLMIEWQDGSLFNLPSPSDLQIVWVIGMSGTLILLFSLLWQLGFIMVGLRMIQNRARHLEV